MRITYLPLVLLIAILGCENKSTTESNSNETNEAVTLKVAAVNYPLSYFASRIGGENVDVIYPIPGDEDPAYWNPSTKEITEYQQADIILMNGAGYAKWAEKVSLPTSKLVNTSSAVSDKYIEVSEGVTHSHGPEGEHQHKGFAFTTWLDISIAKSQATAVYESLLGSVEEGQKASLDQNYQALSAELDELDQQLSTVLSGNSFYASHPVYQYLAQGYDCEIQSLHWEPGQEVDDEGWHQLEHLMEDFKADVMLWEGEPASSVAEKLRANGIEVAVFRTCNSTPESGDFVSIMKANIETLASINSSVE